MNDPTVIKHIITIQRYIKGYLARKYNIIPASNYQTKSWRKSQKWYKNGKYNECEKYQIKLIEKISNQIRFLLKFRSDFL